MNTICRAADCNLPLPSGVGSSYCQLHRGLPETQVDWPFPGLTRHAYGAILADPPWSFALRSDKGYDKSAEAHYATMVPADIAALPVADLAAKDCLLFLWATWPLLPQAFDLIRAWGFTYKTGGPWVKLATGGGPAFGTGFILRSASEVFLIATRGAPRYGSKRIRNLIETEVWGCELLIRALRREHSRKPPEARDMIRQMVPDVRYAELFGREPWAGADVWGNEPQKFGRTT